LYQYESTVIEKSDIATSEESMFEMLQEKYYTRMYILISAENTTVRRGHNTNFSQTFSPFPHR